ncbi:MAG: sigma-70 family RNA polymerase sigma factor [Planctomycetes bacterium]|nr:sigma-70 family RNA polymerase sigma factor [Planctomycetota bacterium]
MNQQDLFRQEWVRWQPRIYAYIRSLVFNRSDAEDLLQEVAEVLWRKIDSYEPGTPFDHWAFTVARNKVFNFRKKKGRERMQFSDALEATLAAEAASDTGKTGDLSDSLEMCVEKLPEKHRALLKQRYEPEATSRSVAQALGRSESAVSRALNLIYGLLLTCLDAKNAVAERDT